MQSPTSIYAESSMTAAVTEIGVSKEAANYLNGIDIRNSDRSTLATDTTVELLPSGIISINLGLGDSAAISIRLKTSISSLAFRVSQRYETSLTIMGEGPHMDLLDWKHHLSQWDELEDNGSLSFVIVEVSSNLFPKVSQSQIVDAVKLETERWLKHGYDAGDRWINLAKQCDSATSYPCGVSVSKIVLLIEVKESSGWKDIQRIELNIPMGC